MVGSVKKTLLCLIGFIFHFSSYFRVFNDAMLQLKRLDRNSSTTIHPLILVRATSQAEHFTHRPDE